MLEQDLVIAAQAEIDQRWEAATGYLHEELANETDDSLFALRDLLISGDVAAAVEKAPSRLIGLLAALAIDEAILRLNRSLES